MLEAIFDSAPSGVAVVDRAGRVIAANQTLATMTRSDRSALLGQAWLDMLHRDDWSLDAELAVSALAGRSQPPTEARLVCMDGTVQGVLLSVATVRDEESGSRFTTEDGQPMYLLRLVTEAPEQQRVVAELAGRAGRDSLTGLADRSLLLEHLRQSIRSLSREAGAVTLLFFDLDRFKVVNDSLGHAAGDLLLQGVANRLTQAFRPEDLVARLGGDEFVVMVVTRPGPDIPARDVIAAAERIRDALRAPLNADGRRIVTTASIGIATTADPTTDPAVLLRDADIAMYVAKQRGGDGFEMFDEPLRTAVAARLELERDLREALAHRAPTVVYQPIVNLGDGAVIAAEALVRWHHPQRGLLLPGAFIPLAEETGLIGAVDELVLELACRQAADWYRRFGAAAPAVRVNLSVRDLADPDLVPHVADLLESTGLPAEQLCFEIPETALVAGLARSSTALSDLHERGVRVAIDDFGTRYASLAYITQFPIDMIKVDPEFVRRVDTDQQHAAMVGAITSLARTLHLHVTAEGVETSGEVETLRRLGCTHGQGNFWGSPGAPELIDLMLVR